jgi:hypothetical protein
MKFPPMRTQEQIQKAHDILLAVAKEPELRTLASKIENTEMLAMAGAALCWALAHDRVEGEESSAGNFGTLLKALDALVEEECETGNGPYEVKKAQ